jgi:hypothetical protein
MLVTEFLPATGSSSPDPDPLSLVPLDEPLTILSSRPAYRRLREPLTIAQAPSAPAVEVAPSPPPSYGDLRGELLPAQPTDPAAGLFRWF